MNNEETEKEKSGSALGLLGTEHFKDLRKKRDIPREDILKEEVFEETTQRKNRIYDEIETQLIEMRKEDVIKREKVEELLESVREEFDSLIELESKGIDRLRSELKNAIADHEKMRKEYEKSIKQNEKQFLKLEDAILKCEKRGEKYNDAVIELNEGIQYYNLKVSELNKKIKGR